jgi:GNAT superfamily N-acetyltransferase
MVEPSVAELWAKTVVEGFAEQFPATSGLLRLIASFCERPTTTAFLALIDDQPAGGGALSVHNRVAALYGASTLPAFRRRGVQTALLHALVRHAAATGCDLAYTLTQPGSASQRNVERYGFRVACTRVLMTKD